MSPELLDPDKFGLEDSRPTKESDCYALGMVIYEVLRANSLRAVDELCRRAEGRRRRTASKTRRNEGGVFTDDLWGMGNPTRKSA